jgi:hypothetical protein
MLDMSYKAGVVNVGFNSARAESVSTGGAEDQNLMSTLTMVAISVIASRLVAYGKITPDIAAAAAGGAAFIAGDILATKKLKEAKKKIETSIERNKKGDITDEQRQSIMRLIDMYKASKEAAETKKNLQLAAAAAFAAAAVLAYMAYTTEQVALKACSAALQASGKSAISAGVACDASSYGSCGGTVAGEACSVAADTLMGTIEAYSASREVPAPTCTAMPSVIGTRTTVTTTTANLPTGCTMWAMLASPGVTACNGLFAAHLGNEPSCLPPAILYATTAAAVLLMGITASTIITIVVGISAPLAEMVDIALYTPGRRAIVWGALAGLAFAASSSTSAVITQIEGDIQKLENLLKTINSQESGIAGNNAINKPSTVTQNVNNSGLVFKGVDTNEYSLENNGYKLPCAAKDKNGNCASLSGTINSATSITGLPDAVSSSLSDLGTLADGLSGASNVSGATQNAINNLAAKANAIGASLKNVRSGTQKFLIGSKNKINFDNEEKKLKDSMNKAFKDAMVKSKSNSKALLASFGTGAAMGDINKATEDTAKLLGDKMPKGLGDFKMPAMATPEMPAMPNYAQGSDSPTADELAKMENSDEAGKSGVTMDDYEIKTDITRDSKENIFDVISKRYKKSGYPRLFKRLAE